MSLWPVSPTNGQTTTVNGIVYTYNTTQTAWVRTGTSSTGDITGANGTFSGNLTVTGNANVGNLGTAQVLASDNITTPQFISNISTGTAPFVVSSNTVVANLNANLLNGATSASANTGSTIALRDTNGNLSANFFIGNGSALTGLSTTSISNGNSNVNIPTAAGNVNISANGVANVAVITSNAIYRGSYNISGFIYQAATAPASPQPGDQWYNTTNGILFEYLNDGTSSQWVDVGSIPGAVSVNNIVNGNSNVNIPSANGNVTISSAGIANVLVITGTGANIAGTANVSGNANVGNLNSAGNVTAPYIISTTNVIFSVATGISAAGTTQATGTAINKDFNVVSTVLTGNGVTLPTAVAGMRITVLNTSANALAVYPLGNGIINSAAANVAYSQPAGARLDFICTAAATAPGGQWYTLNATYG